MKVIKKVYQAAKIFKCLNSKYQYYINRLESKGGAKKEKQTICKYDVEGNMQKYIYNKPNYFVFIEHNWQAFIRKEEKSLVKQPSLIENMFIATMRGILDSMYREFLYYRKANLVCKLPDFVYSWLGNYQIGKRSRKIKPLDIGMRNVDDKDNIRTQFLVDL